MAAEETQAYSLPPGLLTSQQADLVYDSLVESFSPEEGLVLTNQRGTFTGPRAIVLHEFLRAGTDGTLTTDHLSHLIWHESDVESRDRALRLAFNAQKIFRRLGFSKQSRELPRTQANRLGAGEHYLVGLATADIPVYVPPTPRRRVPDDGQPDVTQEGFGERFVEYRDRINRYLFRLLGDYELAEDLTQDVFTDTYRFLGTGTIQERGLSAWLYRAATNAAADVGRRRRLIAWLPLSLFNEDRGVGAGLPGGLAGDDAYHGKPELQQLFATSAYDGARFEQRIADRQIVDRVLDKLPPKYSVPLLLYEHEGFSCAEIAGILKTSPSAVKMTLMRAREHFIALYKQETAEN